MTSWMNLTESQKRIYMEFHAPIINNVKVMPENLELIPLNLVYPTPDMINEALLSELEYNNTINTHLTDSQINAVLFWIQEIDDINRYD